MAATRLETILIGDIRKLNQLSFGRIVTITASSIVTASSLFLSTDGIRGFIVVIIVTLRVNFVVVFSGIGMGILGITGQSTAGQSGDNSNEKLK